MNPATSTAQWYKVSIPAAERSTQGKTLQNDFETLFAINRAPNGAALFTSRGEEEHVFYFSPGAVAIARGLIQHFSGGPCPAPVMEGNNPVLLVGHRGARDILLKSAKNTLKPGLRRKLDQMLGRD